MNYKNIHIIELKGDSSVSSAVDTALSINAIGDNNTSFPANIRTSTNIGEDQQ